MSHLRPDKSPRDLLKREYHAALDRAQQAADAQEQAIASAHEFAALAEQHREYASEVVRLLGGVPDLPRDEDAS